MIETSIPWFEVASFAPLAIVMLIILFVLGLPIPVGYERGKVKWISWCGTGMHAHIVYYHGGDWGFQTQHPADSENK